MFKEIPGECYACGSMLTMLAGDILKPVTNAEWDSIRSMRPEKPPSGPTCMRCGKALPKET